MKEKIIIDNRKVLKYLLNTNHPDGYSKANFFKNCGFDEKKPDEFQNAMRNHFHNNSQLAVKIETPFGIKMLLEGFIETPKRRNVLIRSVWFNELNSELIKLVTAYPSK